MNKKRKRISLPTVVSIAEILSSLAVVISIVYLVGEYKRTQALNNRSIDSEIYSRIVEMNRLLIENSDMADIVIKASTHPDSLLPAEKVRYLAYEHIFYDSWESLWFNYLDGIVDEETWDSWNHWFLTKAKGKSVLGWQGNKQNFDQAFLQYLEEVLPAQ